MKVHGLAEIDRALERLPKDVAKKELRASLMAGGAILQKEWKNRAPVRAEPGYIRRSFGETGRGFLKQSIRRAILKRGTASMTVGVGIGRAFWGMLIEFGTRFMPARPWARPGWDAKKAQVLAAIKERLIKGVEKNALLLGSKSIRNVKARR